MNHLSESKRNALRGMLNTMIRETNGYGLFAVLVSADGLEMAASDFHEARDQVSAGASAMLSIAKGMGQQMNSGGLRQLVAEYENNILVLVSVADGSLLVLEGTSLDHLGDLVFAAHRLAGRVGEFLAAAPRSAGPEDQQISVP